MQNALIFASVIALLGILLLIPAIMDKASDNGWFAALFPKSASPTVMEISPKFDLVDKDGSVIYPDRLRGIEGKIAFSENSEVVAKSDETVAKIFWYAWGDPSELVGAQLVATAVNLDTGEKFLADESVLSGSINGADAHAVTNFHAFPSKGKWRLDVKLNGQPYASIVIAVKDEYIHTDSARFTVSKDDAVTGETMTTLILPGHDLDETIEVRVYPVNDRDNVRNLTFNRSAEFIQAMKPITQYWGTLRFDSPGEWQVEVLGEKTIIKVRDAQ
jgi:hypothetical protein